MSLSQSLKSASARTLLKRLVTRCKNEEAGQPFRFTNKSEVFRSWTCLMFPTSSWSWGITGRPNKRPSIPTCSQTTIESQSKRRIACTQQKCHLMLLTRQLKRRIELVMSTESTWTSSIRFAKCATTKHWKRSNKNLPAQWKRSKRWDSETVWGADMDCSAEAQQKVLCLGLKIRPMGKREHDLRSWSWHQALSKRCTINLELSGTS